MKNFMMPEFGSDVGMVGRAGRVLYWAGVAIAVTALAVGSVVFFDELGDLYRYYPLGRESLLPASIAATISFIVGRGLCYVLAGE